MARPVTPPLPPHEHDDEYAAISHAHDWTEIADKPATFDPTPHVHPVADIDATGTADGTTYLRGDGTWETPDGGAVDSVNAQTGAVVLDADDIDDTTATHKYVTAADLAKLSNTSGTNTGDQNLAPYALTSSLAGVATSGAYVDLTGKPTIPTTLAGLDTTVTGAQLNALKTKVDGVASGATANSSDATLLNRANHTGTQTASTISNFQSTVSANTDVAANTSARHTHANAAVLNATTASYTTALDTKLSGIATGATANATDAQLRDRATHTGAQAISTVTGLQTALDGKADDTDLTSYLTTAAAPELIRDTMGTALVAGANVTITPNDAGDTITIASSGGGGGGGVTDHTLLTNIGTNTHAQIDTHIASTANPHSVTKAQVGLGSVDNTSDANKPVSTATSTALAGKAATAHTHVATTDLTATGTKSSATYLRGDNTWNTPTNTTYTEITSAEITAGTASTARTISGRRSEEIVTKARTGMAATSHTHAVADTTGLQAALDGKASTSHNHDADYADIVHTHVYADITDAPAPLALAGDGVATTAAKSDHQHKGGGGNSIAIGGDAPGDYSIVLGAGASSADSPAVPGAIAIGSGYTDAESNILPGAHAVGGNAIAIGVGSVSSNVFYSPAVAIGQQATAHELSVALGYLPSAVAPSTIAIGGLANASSQYAIAMGEYSISSASASIAIGNGAEAVGNNAISIGTAYSSGGIAIGNGANASAAGSFAVGSVSAGEKEARFRQEKLVLFGDQYASNPGSISLRREDGTMVTLTVDNSNNLVIT